MNDYQCRLIELAKQGDEHAFEQLYMEFYKLALYFALKLCRNEADAKDAVQDAFMEIHRSITGLKETSYFKAWLYKIVHTKCKKIFRKNKYTTTDFEAEPQIGNMKEERIEYTPEQFFRFHSDQEVLNACINRLPQQQKEIIVLFYLEQMSIKEIADIMDVPIGTVKSRLAYGRNYLKNMLEEYHAEQGEPISFHALDAMIATMLVRELAQMSYVIPNLATSASFLAMYKDIWAQLVTFGTCVGMLFGAYALVQSHYATQEEYNSEHKFSPVVMQHEVISTAQDAYFTLISWACCEEMIQQKKADEIAAILPLYNELKRCGGAYYEELVQQQWSAALEQRINP